MVNTVHNNTLLFAGKRGVRYAFPAKLVPVLEGKNTGTANRRTKYVCVASFVDSMNSDVKIRNPKVQIA